MNFLAGNVKNDGMMRSLRSDHKRPGNVSPE